MYCSYCGKEVVEGAKFCRFCGCEIPQKNIIATENINDKPMENESNGKTGSVEERASEIGSIISNDENTKQSQLFVENEGRQQNTSTTINASEAARKKKITIISIAVMVGIFVFAMGAIFIADYKEKKEREAYRIQREQEQREDALARRAHCPSMDSFESDFNAILTQFYKDNGAKQVDPKNLLQEYTVTEDTDKNGNKIYNIHAIYGGDINLSARADEDGIINYVSVSADSTYWSLNLKSDSKMIQSLYVYAYSELAVISALFENEYVDNDKLVDLTVDMLKDCLEDDKLEGIDYYEFKKRLKIYDTSSFFSVDAELDCLYK